MRFAIKFEQNAKIREKVGCSADMGCNGGRHLFTADAELKILIFGAGGSSIRPLGTITGIMQLSILRIDSGQYTLFSTIRNFQPPFRCHFLCYYYLGRYYWVLLLHVDVEGSDNYRVYQHRNVFRKGTNLSLFVEFCSILSGLL